MVWLFYARREAVAGTNHEGDVDVPALDRDGAWTLVGLLALAIGALLFKVEIGFMALMVILALAMVAPLYCVTKGRHGGGMFGL